MENSEKKKGVPTTTLMLDKVYELQFGFSCQRRFKALFEISIEDALRSNFDREMAANALWVMLLKYNPELTKEEVDELLDKYYEGSVTEAVTFITDAVSYSLNGKTLTEMLEEITNAAAAEDEDNSKNVKTPE